MADHAGSNDAMNAAADPKARFLPDRVRAFLAVNLTVDSVNRVARAQAAMRAAAEQAGWRVAWVGPAQMHATLKFFGHVQADLVWGIRDRLGRLLADRAPLDVEAAGGGAFPDGRPPRVLWLGLRGEDRLARLAADVEEAMAAMGFAREKRPFHAHVTVGRVKDSPGAADALDAILAPLRDASFGTSPVREVVLYESRLRAAGAEYTPLARVPLTGARLPDKRPDKRDDRKEPTHGG